MNSKTLLTVATAVLALVGAASAVAGDAPNGRSAPSVSGEKAFEIQVPFTSVAKRADVRMAAVEAARVAGRGVSGEKSGDVEGPFTSTLTRAQVVAELREAIRIGAVDFGGDHGPRTLPTDAQLEQIRQAGLKALTMSMASR